MSSPVCYFTDEHVANAVTRGLQRRGVDALTIVKAGLLGADDEDLLTFVREEKRVIVTQDRDFLRMAAREYNHPGVVYAPQDRSIGQMV